MKRMRFVLGLFIGVLLVIALALPIAVLAEETAPATEAETSVAEAAAETAAAAEAQTSPVEEAAETTATEADTAPGEAAPQSPAEEEAETSPGEETPESPAPTEPETGPGEETPESNATAIEGLISTVQGLNLQQGIENSLDVKLQNARDSLTAANAGLREDAVNKLQAFINACEAQRDKALTTVQADELIAKANAIIASL